MNKYEGVEVEIILELLAVDVGSWAALPKGKLRRYPLDRSDDKI
jgi:hypothetical protein